jgi:hypothetical protein
VVGLPLLPIGSWSSQRERSKLPPGAQLGFRAPVVVVVGLPVVTVVEMLVAEVVGVVTTMVAEVEAPTVTVTVAVHPPPPVTVTVSVVVWRASVPEEKRSARIIAARRTKTSVATMAETLIRAICGTGRF